MMHCFREMVDRQNTLNLMIRTCVKLFYLFYLPFLLKLTVTIYEQLQKNVYMEQGFQEWTK